MGEATTERQWRDRTTTGIVLLNQAGQVLMQLRDDIPTIADPGCWVIPGGESAPGEAPEVGARREFLEETGYRIAPDDLHFVLERDLARPQGTVERQYYYLAWYDGAQPLTCYEGQELRFVDPATVSTLKTSPGLKEIIRAAVERFGSSERCPEATRAVQYPPPAAQAQPTGSRRTRPCQEPP